MALLLTLLGAFATCSRTDASESGDTAWHAYERGDRAAAAKLYAEAARRGERLAHFNYAMMLLRREAVATERGEALRWLRKAADAGMMQAPVSARLRRRRKLSLSGVLPSVFPWRESILLTVVGLTFAYAIQMRNNLLRFDVRTLARLLAYLAYLALTPQAAQAQQEPAAKPASGKWQTYRNERYGFHLSYPPDSQVHTRRDPQYQYVRIQNYEPDHQGDLLTGEYYLEVFIFDHRAGHKLPSPCRELIPDARPVKAGKVNALRGLGDHVSDPGGTPFALCLQGVKVDVLVTATEEGQLGPLANRILDSVRFGN